MKYIQCQHCQKKYAASEKLCASAGKKIRCKYCQQVFEIIIHDSPPINENTEQEELPDDNEKLEINTSPVKKKFNFQLLISILLAIALLTTTTVAYLFFYQHELFEPSQKQDEKQLIPSELIKPVNITFPKQKHALASENAQAKTVQPASQVKKAKSLLDGPDKPSQACKDSSADYWFRTRLLITSQLDSVTYMELLNQNLDQVEEIQRLCKDKLLIAHITESAKKGQMPTWISTEITSRTKAMQTQKKAHQERP